MEIQDIHAGNQIHVSSASLGEGLGCVAPGLRDPTALGIGAAAIPGSIYANGVVLITTKSGSKEDGKGKFNAYFTTSVTEISKTYDMLDGVGYADYQNAIQAAAGNPPRYAVQSGKVYSFVTNLSLIHI